MKPIIPPGAPSCSFVVGSLVLVVDSPPLVMNPMRNGVCPEQTSALPVPIVVRKYLPQILMDPCVLAVNAMAAELTALGIFLFHRDSYFLRFILNKTISSYLPRQNPHRMLGFLVGLRLLEYCPPGQQCPESHLIQKSLDLLVYWLLRWLLYSRWRNNCCFV